MEFECLYQYEILGSWKKNTGLLPEDTWTPHSSGSTLLWRRSLERSHWNYWPSRNRVTDLNFITGCTMPLRPIVWGASWEVYVLPAGCPPESRPSAVKSCCLSPVSWVMMQPPGDCEWANYWGTWACSLTASCLWEAGSFKLVHSQFEMTPGEDVSSPVSGEPSEQVWGVPEQSCGWHGGDTHPKGAPQARKISPLKVFLWG